MRLNLINSFIHILKNMTFRKLGLILWNSLALTSILLIIEINLFKEDRLSKIEFNEILFWSFIKGLFIAISVNTGNNLIKK